MQSVPYAQVFPVTLSSPAAPSWQCELRAYGPPSPNECARHSSEQSMGGGVEGGGGGLDGGAGGLGDGGGGGGRLGGCEGELVQQPSHEQPMEAS